MVKVKSVYLIGFSDVYNMEVENHRNYAVNGGFIVHNCDSIRAFCVYWQHPTETAGEAKRKAAKWTPDQWEDYGKCKTQEQRDHLIRKWGNPFRAA